MLVLLHRNCLFDTVAPTSDSYEHAFAALNAHFAVKKNIPFERSVFNQASQKHGESIEQYVTRLRKLASACKYADQTDDQIRDQVIATCLSSQLRKKCLTEPSLTLGKLVKIGQAMESALYHSKEIEPKSDKASSSVSANNDPEYLNYLRWKQLQPSKPFEKKFERKSKKSCGRCGASVHLSSECRRCKDVECHNCLRKSHFSKMCRSKGSSASKASTNPKSKHSTSQLKYELDESESSEDNDDIYFFRINSSLES